MGTATFWDTNKFMLKKSIKKRRKQKLTIFLMGLCMFILLKLELYDKSTNY